MAKSDSINSALIELLSCHLEQIALACSTLKIAGHELVADGADDVLSAAVISLAERTGWRADACLALLKQGQSRGGFEDWVSSPRETTAREKLTATEAAAEARVTA